MRLALGTIMTVVAVVLAGRRFVFITRLIRSGQPSPGRLADLPAALRAEITDVFAQRKLLKRPLPGLAHFFTFWAFIILLPTILEAYGALFTPNFTIPFIGHAWWLGALEDLFAVAVLAALVIFTVIRFQQSPRHLSRRSRFFGSHTGAAWVILGMIFLVIVTLLIYRGAQVNTGHFPYTSLSIASYAVGRLLAPLGEANAWIETTFILAQIGIVLAFLVIVAYSKHLHIFTAPFNVLFSRRPKALGPLLKPPVDFDALMESEDEVTVGAGKIEDFGWKAYLDFATCTECGRCQDQCPAWNTGKPLSPKLVITDLRDHLFAKAPAVLAGPDGAELPAAVRTEADRALVGPRADGGVIDPDVLWSCTTCGACVEQCPVDIEHVDHILDMRRYQVLIESAFPSEAGTMLRGLENHGNPWGLPARKRTEWLADLPFPVRVVEPGSRIPDDVEYLYWVGCAGALEDRSKKTARAFVDLLHAAGVSFAVLGAAETCSGDPARRLGNEYLYQELAKANVATLDEVGARKIVATCPHCFNTLANEYPQLGGHYEVIHHTQLLGRLVADGRLTPVASVDAKVTYHDPCYLGRHNEVYTPPREVLASIPGLDSQEMHRCKSRGFCCGAGGARMWMEERIGKSINVERVDEALGLDPDVISTACPYCMVMLSDAVTAKKQTGEARESVEVLDVAQLLARSLRPVGLPGGGDPGTAGETG